MGGLIHFSLDAKILVIHFAISIPVNYTIEFCQVAIYKNPGIGKLPGGLP